MRPFSILGLVLILLGVVELSVRSITYFSTQNVTGPLGFFSWDVSEPHTLFFSPFAGIVAIIVGVALVFMVPRRAAG
jgi:membrane-bound ClpP family serine protease